MLAHLDILVTLMLIGSVSLDQNLKYYPCEVLQLWFRVPHPIPDSLSQVTMVTATIGGILNAPPCVSKLLPTPKYKATPLSLKARESTSKSHRHFPTTSIPLLLFLLLRLLFQSLSIELSESIEQSA